MVQGDLIRLITFLEHPGLDGMIATRWDGFFWNTSGMVPIWTTKKSVFIHTVIAGRTHVKV